MPADLKHLYGEVADGGFGPGAGLFSIAQAVEAHREMSDEPAGPQGQEWPAGLCPLVDNEPGYSCIDLDSGEMIDWDPEEIEGYSDAAWRRSFKPSGTTFGAWIDRWNNAESR
ncbi:MAG: hypothetical protein ABIQ43_02535 [Sphingomonas sp.]